MADNQRDIKIKVITETQQAINEIKKINRELDTLKKQNGNFKETTENVNQMTRSFASLTKHVGQLAVIYGGFQGLVTTVKTFADFEQAIVKLGVTSEASTTKLAAMEAESLRLGETTIFSATQVATGMTAMVTAGLSAEQAMVAIAPAADMAAIGMISIEEAAGIATATMNGFGLKAEDVSHITDVMAKSATMSATDIVGLGDSFEKVAPIATAYGVSIEETTAALGVMADAGRVGSEAGTQLKIVLQRLAADKEAAKYLKELGVNIYDANGNLLPFTEQLRNLKAKLDELSPALRNIKISEIFGTEAASTGIVLLNQIDQIEKKTESLIDSYGYGAAAAKGMMDSLSGEYKKFKGALESLVIRLVDEFSPALESALVNAREFIAGLDADQLREFGESVQSLITVIAEMGSVIVGVVGIIKSLSDGIESLLGISNSTQLEIIALGYALSSMHKLALSLAGGLVVLIEGLAGAKMAQLGLTAAMVANPFTAIILGLTMAAVGAVGLVNDYQKLEDQVVSTNKALDLNKNALDATRESLLAMDTAARKAYGDFIQNQIKDTELKLGDLNKQMEEGVKGWTGNYEALDKLIEASAALGKQWGDLKAKEEEIAEVNKEAIKISNAQAKATADEARKIEELAKAYEKLTPARQAELEKTKESHRARLATAQDGAIKLFETEKKLFDDLRKLEDDLAKIRKGYADKRASLEVTVAGQIADVYAKGLDNYQGYLNAQKRADESYANAKKALAAGDINLAKQYSQEYQALITKGAGEEIAVKKTVKAWNSESHKWEMKEIDDIRVSKSQSAKEFEKDALAGKRLTGEIYSFEEQEEIRLHNIKIADKKLELQMLKIQIESQMVYVQQLEKITELLKGVKLDIDYTKTLESIKQIDTEMARIADTERTAKLTLLAETSGAEAEVATVQKEAAKPLFTKFTVDGRDVLARDIKPVKDEASKPIFSKFEVDGKSVLKEDVNPLKKEAEKPMESKLDVKTEVAKKEVEYVQKAGKEPISTTMNVDTIQATTSVNTLQALGRQPITSTHIHDTASAISTVNAFRSLAERDIITHQYIYQHTIQAKQNGGLINPMPRFADGGHLENGVGHSRKSGKLGGYGGGDKVKALLEAGEFIVRKEAVKKLGLARMSSINQGVLPKFQTGGFVSPMQKFDTGGIAQAPTVAKNVNLSLMMPDNKTSFNMQTDEQIANALERYIRKYQ